MADAIIDISPTLNAALKVWPGDTPLSREVLCDMAAGDNLTLSSLHATVHLGAHADAPSHYGPSGRTIEEQDLALYVGPCQVMHVPGQRVPGQRVSGLGGRRLTPADLPEEPRALRVLLRTDTFPDPTSFNEDFAALSPELVDWLVDRGVRLVGVDTPSVDLFEDRTLVAHHACLRRDLAILEGLVLGNVQAGMYELIALPLKLAGFDASPVRAILRTLPATTPAR